MSSEDFGLYVAIISSCSLSICGSILIVLSYVLWKDIRSPLRRLLVYLSITDFLTATGNILGVSENRDPVICKVQSFVSTSSAISSFLWTMSIAIYLYLVISKRHTFALKMIPLFHMVSWGVPLMLVCFAMGFDALGVDNESGIVGWCWIAEMYYIQWPIFSNLNYTNLFWKLVAGKGIELFTYIFTPIVYILSKRQLDFVNYDQRLLLNNSVRTTLQDTDRKLVLIPLIFVGCRIWGSVRFLAAVWDRNVIVDFYWLAFLQGIGDSAQGWANCFLFCIFTRKIRDKFVDKIQSIFCCSSEDDKLEIKSHEVLQ